MASRTISKKTIIEFGDIPSDISDISKEEFDYLLVDNYESINQESYQQTRSPDIDNISTNPPSMPNTRRYGSGPNNEPSDNFSSRLPSMPSTRKGKRGPNSESNDDISARPPFRPERFTDRITNDRNKATNLEGIYK